MISGRPMSTSFIAAAERVDARQRLLEEAARFGLYVHAAFVPLSIAGMQFGLAVAGLSLLALSLLGRRVWFRSALDLPVLALLLVVLLWPWDATIGSRLYRTFLSPLIVASVLGLRPRTMRSDALRVLAIWAGFALIPSLLAWAQFFAGLDVLHELGLRARPVRPTVPLYAERYAATGFFKWYIRLAHNLSAPLCLLAALAVHGGLPPRWRRAALVATAAIGAAVFLTFTRTAWYGLALAALVLAAFGGRRVFATTVIGLAVVGAVLFAVQPGFRNRVLSTLSGERNQDRIGIWQTCAAVARDHPEGIGFGNMPIVGGPYFDRVAPETVVRAWCHNTFFTAYVEGGIPYLLAALLFWAWLGLAFLRMARRADRLGRAACAGGLAGLAAMGVNAMAHDLFYASETVYGMGLALALAVILARPPEWEPAA